MPSSSTNCLLIITFLCLSSGLVSSFGSSFVSSTKNQMNVVRSESNLKMIDIDANVAAGAAIGIGGFVAGIGMLRFAEAQGEKAEERGAGLSDNMSKKYAGMFMEDVEVSSIEDLGSLTSKLEQALKATGGTTENFEMTEEEKQKVKDDLEDGW